MTSILPQTPDESTPEQQPTNLVLDLEVRDMVERTSTADLYELAADVLAELDRRGQRLGAIVGEEWAPKLPPDGEFIPLKGIGGDLGAIDHGAAGWSASYYTEECAEDASRQFGTDFPREAGDV